MMMRIFINNIQIPSAGNQRICCSSNCACYATFCCLFLQL